MTFVFFAVVAIAYVTEIDSFAVRKFSKKVLSGYCTSETRTSGLNCSCALGIQRQRCSFSSNSQCINGKCSCTGSDYPDCATGSFCRVKFRINPVTTASLCYNASATAAQGFVGISSSTTLGFAGQPRQSVACTATVSNPSVGLNPGTGNTNGGAGTTAIIAAAAAGTGTTDNSFNALQTGAQVAPSKDILALAVASQALKTAGAITVALTATDITAATNAAAAAKAAAATAATGADALALTIAADALTAFSLIGVGNTPSAGQQGTATAAGLAAGSPIGAGVTAIPATGLVGGVTTAQVTANNDIKALGAAATALTTAGNALTNGPIPNAAAAIAATNAAAAAATAAGLTTGADAIALNKASAALTLAATGLTGAQWTSNMFYISSTGKVTFYNTGTNSVTATTAGVTGYQPVSISCTDACGITVTGTLNMTITTSTFTAAGNPC
jgi:hypothetical protein